MGYTVSTGKQVAAFVRDNGDIVYALFERTHESNVFPQTPRWGCIAIGSYAEVMLRVFQRATSCEGGMLKGSGNRDIKPENYIAGWRRELLNPVLMDDFDITLTVGSWRSPIDSEKLEEAFSALKQIGRNDIVDAVRDNGRVNIGLYRDVDVVLALYGVDRLFAPWHVLYYVEWRTILRPEFGAVARNEAIQPPKVRVLANKGHCIVEMIVQLDDGEWKQCGADYSAMSQYLLQVVYPCEMKQTGCHKRLIAEFRDLCTAAPTVPANTKLKLLRNAEGASKWNQETFDKLVAKLGGPQGAVEFETTLGDVFAVEHGSFELGYLLENQVVWNIESVPTQPVSQLSLLAA